MRRKTNTLLWAGVLTGAAVGVGYYLWKRKIPKPTKPVAALPQTKPAGSEIGSDMEFLAQTLFG